MSASVVNAHWLVGLVDPLYVDNDEVNWSSFDKELVEYKRRIRDWPNSVPVFMKVPTSNKYSSKQEKILLPAICNTLYAVEQGLPLDGLLRYEDLLPGTNNLSSRRDDRLS